MPPWLLAVVARSRPARSTASILAATAVRSSGAVYRQNAARRLSSRCWTMSSSVSTGSAVRISSSTFAGGTRPSSMASHHATSAAPRVSGSRIVCSDVVRYSSVARSRSKNPYPRPRPTGSTHFGAASPAASGTGVSAPFTVTSRLLLPAGPPTSTCSFSVQMRWRPRASSSWNESRETFPPATSRSVRIAGRPRSSTQALLQAARSAGVRTSRMLTRSVHVALPNACALRYSRSPSRNSSGPMSNSSWRMTTGAF